MVVPRWNWNGQPKWKCSQVLSGTSDNVGTGWQVQGESRSIDIIISMVEAIIMQWLEASNFEKKTVGVISLHVQCMHVACTCICSLH